MTSAETALRTLVLCLLFAIGVATYAHWDMCPLDFQQYFVQLTSELHKVYNGQLCLVLYSIQLRKRVKLATTGVL